MGNPVKGGMNFAPEWGGRILLAAGGGGVFFVFVLFLFLFFHSAT